MFWRELILLFLTTVVSVHLLPVGPPGAVAIDGARQIGEGKQNAAKIGSSKNYLEVTHPKSIQKRHAGVAPRDKSKYEDEEDNDLHASNDHWKALGTKKGFSPWGGKRTVEEAEDEELVDLPARRGFQPWGGKRQAEINQHSLDDLEANKFVQVRSFNPWGGKRSHNAVFEMTDEDDGEDEDEEEGALEKRKFQPWGGKRAWEVSPPLPAYLKRRFQPWGGKRQIVDIDELKRRFNPWAGKRSALGPTELEDGVDQDMDTDDLEEHKRKFQPWGGKRSSFQPWGGKRSSFQPWGGKRGSFQPWGGKRPSFQPWGGKRRFNPWGGKRDASNLDKRPAFQPWAGKRSNHLDSELMDDLLAELPHSQGTLK